MIKQKVLFAKAQGILERQDHEVINPFEISPYIEGKEWSEYMRDTIEKLVRCDAIFMLPGWKDSTGAVLEHSIASNLGITAITL